MRKEHRLCGQRTCKAPATQVTARHDMLYFSVCQMVYQMVLTKGLDTSKAILSQSICNSMLSWQAQLVHDCIKDETPSNHVQ